MTETQDSVIINCPRCKGQLRASAGDECQLSHTLPLCASFERVKTVDDAADLLEEARETMQRELGLPVTPDIADA